MPNRIIKESIHTSKSINSLTDFQFRLWAYLITYVDDYGRGNAEPEIIKGMCFPRRKGVTDCQIEKALSELANADIIRLYESDGESYLYFPNWDKHQQIRAKKSKCPAPDNNSCINDNNGNHLKSNDSKCPRNPIQSESNPNPESESNKNVARETRHAHGEYGWVKLTDAEYSRLVAEFGEAEANRCIDYVDQSAQQTGNKNRWKDWNLTVRKCHRDGWGKNQSGKPDCRNGNGQNNAPETNNPFLKKLIEMGGEYDA